MGSDCGSRGSVCGCAGTFSPSRDRNPHFSVRPNGADHQWGKDPPKEAVSYTHLTQKGRINDRRHRRGMAEAARCLGRVRRRCVS